MEERRQTKRKIQALREEQEDAIVRLNAEQKRLLEEEDARERELYIRADAAMERRQQEAAARRQSVEEWYDRDDDEKKLIKDPLDVS